jgi:iron complex transport system substrate-binding protein
LTSAKLDADACSAEIDARVKQIVGDGLSIYRVDATLLRELSPDVILTQDQCEVCAVSLSDVEQALADWLGTRPRVVSLDPQTLGDVWGDVVRVADALGEPGRGRDLAAQLTESVARTARRAARAGERPKVALVEWIEPLMAAGNWMPELVTLAGGDPLFGEAGVHSPWIGFDELRAAAPDVIVVLPCGFDLARTRAEMGPLVTQPGWRDLPAVRSGRVFLTDGNQYFNRPGPRLADSLEILAEILHPEVYAPKHERRVWQRL